MKDFQMGECATRAQDRTNPIWVYRGGESSRLNQSLSSFRASSMARFRGGRPLKQTSESGARADGATIDGLLK
jgi:hypothetical protein